MLNHDIRAPPRRGTTSRHRLSVTVAQQGTPHRPVTRPVREALTAQGD